MTAPRPTCSAEGCDHTVAFFAPLGLCKWDWYRLPNALREDVRAALRAGGAGTDRYHALRREALEQLTPARAA